MAYKLFINCKCKIMKNFYSVLFLFWEIMQLYLCNVYLYFISTYLLSYCTLLNYNFVS